MLGGCFKNAVRHLVAGRRLARQADDTAHVRNDSFRYECNDVLLTETQKCFTREMKCELYLNDMTS